MFTILSIIIGVAAVLLIGIVLVQKSRGGGFATQFGDFERKWGAQTSARFAEKATWILAGFILVSSVACAFIAQ